MDLKAMGMRIRQSRKIKGLTQADLASRINVSTMSIRRYESGERIVTEEISKRIASALDLDADWLMNGYAVDGSIRVTPSPEQQELGELMKKYADGVITDDELQRLGELQARTPPTKEKLGKLTDTLEQMKQCLLPLNDEGQQKVVKHAAVYARDLAKIPEYRRPDPAQPPAEASPAQDIPAAQDAPEGAEKAEQGGW